MPHSCRAMSAAFAHLTTEIQNFPSTFNGRMHWHLRMPDRGFEWRGMNTIKALTTVAAGYRLSGTSSGEHRSSHQRPTLTTTLRTLVWRADREAIDEAWNTLQHQGHPSQWVLRWPSHLLRALNISIGIDALVSTTVHARYISNEWSIINARNSVSYLYQVTGDSQYADRAERIFHNTLWSASNNRESPVNRARGRH